MKARFFFIGLSIAFILCGCGATKRATLKTFIDPSIQTAAVKTVAVLPMRNTAFSPGETMEMDRVVTQSFSQKNSFVSVIGISEATALLNKENLTTEYAAFLENFESSGVPNTVFLNKLKHILNVDAILQGRMSDVHQNDAMRGAHAQSSLTIRYTLLSTSSGRILWEGTSNATIEYAHRNLGKIAPPFYEVGTLAQEKIISSIPALGNQ